MSREWYRRKTWTTEDQADFFARLKRAKPPNRSQYLRIQAIELSETRTTQNLMAAISLIDKLLEEYPESTELAIAWYVKGECLESLGEIDRAVDAYRYSIAQQREFPNVITNVDLAFGWLVASIPLPELYQEALGVLEEFDDEVRFPAQQYRSFAARAFIYDALTDKSAARLWADRALHAAQLNHSGFAHHAKLGLVDKQDPMVQAKLERLAD